MVNSSLTILFLSTTFEGRVHDKEIAEYSAYPLPPSSQLLQDLGFVAFKLDAVEMLQPHKKPRGGVLTPEQKAANQALARRRIRIEHVNSSVKRCRMLKEPLRLWRYTIRDLVMEVACGLHNLRLRYRPWITMS